MMNYPTDIHLHPVTRQESKAFGAELDTAFNSLCIPHSFVFRVTLQSSALQQLLGIQAKETAKLCFDFKCTQYSVSIRSIGATLVLMDPASMNLTHRGYQGHYLNAGKEKTCKNTTK